MTDKKPAFHGSDIEKIEEWYGLRQEQITAFGSNVNPLGISPAMEKALAENVRAVTAYPDRDYKALRAAISAYTKAPAEQIIPGNGSTELISLAMKVTKPKKACIIGPTYGEYRREISLAGGSFFFFYLKEDEDFALSVPRLKEALVQDVDLLVLCNPNNPTGTLVDNDQLAEVLAFCRERNILVVTDETYMEFASPRLSGDTDMDQGFGAVPLLDAFPNLLILRGTSKFFAAPGLRLGYGLCGNRKLLKEMKTLQDPWSVNSLAAEAGQKMFSDEDYIARTKTYIAAERSRIYARLNRTGVLKPYLPAANFILVKILDQKKTAADLFEYAIRQGLMIRDCGDFEGLGPQFFRFCFLDQASNDRLLDCIETFFAH